ncbi:hypothetical protein IGL98_000479 [Enterococcus sp. DIV0840]|uniref:hypothetical protein n=1 Tax=Enterococcus TaxID=1350 RepID=UPI001A90B2CF|nr:MULTISPECIES: hypothetical protein [Enterococcus]MBO0433522.1 hypothetical protein [Enterococcus sp. DIV0849a]MBO0472096.1 hypothetical protein [Enterococcus ureasiticus]
MGQEASMIFCLFYGLFQVIKTALVVTYMVLKFTLLLPLTIYKYSKACKKGDTTDSRVEGTPQKKSYWRGKENPHRASVKEIGSNKVFKMNISNSRSCMERVSESNRVR